MTQAVTLADAGVQGSAKAWVNFAGTTGTITKSYNVSSVTRSNVGSYVINFTNALADANYAVAFGFSRTSGTTSTKAALNYTQSGAYTQTSSSFALGMTTYNDTGWADSTQNTVAVYD